MRCLERFYSPLLTGSEICISYQATNVLLPIVLRVLLLPQPCLRGQLEPSYPTLLLCQAVKDMTHSGSRDKLTLKDCDIQVGDAVLLRQPKREKLSILHHLTLFTVPRKHHSMLTEESADEVTRNIISLQEASG